MYPYHATHVCSYGDDLRIAECVAVYHLGTGSHTGIYGFDYCRCQKEEVEQVGNNIICHRCGDNSHNGNSNNLGIYHLPLA